MAQVIGHTLEASRAGASVTRQTLWEAVSNGLRELVADGPSGGQPSGLVGLGGPAGAWARSVGEWVRRREVLEDGGTVDRGLVEALVEAECALLVFSGEAPSQVAAARRSFEDLSLGTLAPASSADARGR